MDTIETDLLYSSIRKNLKGVIDIFVDGSYSSVTSTTTEEPQPFGAGWALVGSDGTLAGYGVCATWDEYTTSSDLSELRAMLAFLDAVNKNHSHLVDRCNVFRIHSDSQNLIGLLQKNLMQNELPPAMALRYGKDYARIVKYRMEMTLSFHWVKGHAENEFNGMADLFARKCFRKLVSDGSFNGEERLTYIHSVLSSKNAHPTTLPLIKPAEPELCLPEATQMNSKVTLVNLDKAQDLMVWFDSRKLQYKTVYVASMESGVLYDHTIHLDSLNASKNALQVKTLIHALKQYFASDEFDPSLPLRVWSNALIAAGYLNTMVRGKEPKIDSDDLVLKKNLDILRGLISGVQIRCIDDTDGKLSRISAVSNIVFDSHVEKLSQRRHY